MKKTPIFTILIFSLPMFALAASDCSGKIRPASGTNGCEPCEQLYYDGDGLMLCNPGPMTKVYEGWLMKLADPGEITIYDKTNKKVLFKINKNMRRKVEIGSKCNVQYSWKKDEFEPKVTSAFCTKPF